MRPPLLDSQISRALVQPTPWEVAQWRSAALKDKPEWSKLIDLGSSHRFSDEVQRSVDTEIRRERMWCGPAPCVAAAAPVPTELTRNEFYVARQLFAWMAAAYRTEAASKVTAFQDRVALPANGGLAGNARSIDANHAFAQVSAPLQVAGVTIDATMNNREVATFAAASYYDSTLAASPWKFRHDGTGVDEIYVFINDAPASDPAYHIVATSGGASGGYFAIDSATAPPRPIWGVGNATIFIIQTATPASGVLQGVPVFMETSYSETASPKATQYVKSATQLTPAVGGAPLLTAPTSTCRIGAGTGAGFKAKMRLAEVRFANRVDATLRTAQLRGLLLRYGLS